tara:strand:+ start:1717 stop:2916 length:1200 start_codon:yes stop_codon:yes gene_type:complete
MNNRSFYGLPEKVQFCKKCVISNQRPNSVVEFKNKKNIKTGISFDKNGVCSACNFTDKKNENIDWEKREKKLKKILSKYRKKNGYDCLVPGSGGKDSGYVSHLLKYKYGMNPLTVTWAPHIYTEIGWRNFEQWIHTGGLDNILFTPNGKLHRTLTKISFLNLLHPFQPFIVGQRAIAPRIATKFNIPLIIYGENAAEYGHTINENNNPLMSPKFFSTKNINDTYLGGLKINKIMREFNFKINDLEPYLPSDRKEINKKKIKVFYMSYFMKWDPQENFYYASEHTGFKSNSERTEGTYSKYSSIDDKIDNFHWYTTLIKFGIGRATYESAQEIRNDKITREEGVNLVKQYDQEFPKKYFQEFLKYIDIDEKTFFKTIDKFRSPHIWEKKNKKWVLKHQIS